VAISFQLTREDLILRDVVIALPLPSGAGNPIINDPSVGECEYNKQRKQIEWHIPVVDGEDANKSGEIVRPCCLGRASLLTDALTAPRHGCSSLAYPLASRSLRSRTPTRTRSSPCASRSRPTRSTAGCTRATSS